MKPLELFGKYEALIFDCDGTIADSMGIHLGAWNKALSHYGSHLTLADHEKYAGVPTRRIVELLNEAQALTMPVDQVTIAKENAYIELIATVKAVPEVVETIEAFSGRLPMAVVSGSPRASLLKTLEHLKLLDKFAAVFGADDYLRGKPAPDGFLGAARQLNVTPSRCLVFEDGELGIQAAQAAGMKWVRVVPERGGFDLSASNF